MHCYIPHVNDTTFFPKDNLERQTDSQTDRWIETEMDRNRDRDTERGMGEMGLERERERKEGKRKGKRRKRIEQISAEPSKN